MASVKAEKPPGSQQLFGQPKKEAPKAAESAPKSGSKSTQKKAETKPREPKKKGKGGKAAAKN